MVFSSYQLHHVSVKPILETIMIAHKNSSVLHINILWRMAMKGFMKALISAFNHLQKETSNQKITRKTQVQMGG
jgi:hypothetical protein